MCLRSAKPSAVRWRIVALLVAFSIVNYLLRVNLTIAGKPIMQEVQLSAVQLGWIFSAFLFSYTAFMVPAGVWADHIGVRRALAIAGMSWGILTVLTAYLPGKPFLSSIGVIGTFLALRLLFGICSAPTYPGAGRAIAQWMPRSERALANAAVIAGSLLGSAITAPLISLLMVRVGWRQALMLTSIVAPPLVLCWWLYAEDSPLRHRAVNQEELVIIGASKQSEGPKFVGSGWTIVLRSGQAWRLFLIYGLECYLGYIFIWWFFIYLVEVRKFVVVQGGFAAALPFVMGTLSTPLAGALSDRMVLRLGARRGRMIVPAVSLAVAAVLAIVGVQVQNAWLGVVILSVGAALCWANEGPVWAGAIDIASVHTVGAAGGFLNAGSNLGGALAALLTPWIVKEAGWFTAFAVGSVCSFLAALLWLGFDPSKPIGVAAEWTGKNSEALSPLISGSNGSQP